MSEIIQLCRNFVTSKFCFGRNITFIMSGWELPFHLLERCTPPLFGYNNLLSYLNTYVCTIYLYILDICRLTFSFCYLDQITVALVRPAQILFYIFFRKHNIIVNASHSLYFQMWEIIFSCENELSSKNILGIQ